MPIRIQRKRTKGWKMPGGAVAVTRPLFWGNPFRVGGYYRRSVGDFIYLEAREGYQDEAFTRILTAKEAVEWFRWYVETRNWREKIRAELRGKDLACWCPLGQPCHADALLEIANS